MYITSTILPKKPYKNIRAYLTCAIVAPSMYVTINSEGEMEGLFYRPLFGWKFVDKLNLDLRVKKIIACAGCGGMGEAWAGMGTTRKQKQWLVLWQERGMTNKNSFLNAASDTSFGTSCDYLCRRKKATTD